MTMLHSNSFHCTVVSGPVGLRIRAGHSNVLVCQVWCGGFWCIQFVFVAETVCQIMVQFQCPFLFFPMNFYCVWSKDTWYFIVLVYNDNKNDYEGHSTGKKKLHFLFQHMHIINSHHKVFQNHWNVSSTDGSVYTSGGNNSDILLHRNISDNQEFPAHWSLTAPGGCGGTGGGRGAGDLVTTVQFVEFEAGTHFLLAALFPSPFFGFPFPLSFLRRRISSLKSSCSSLSRQRERDNIYFLSPTDGFVPESSFSENEENNRTSRLSVFLINTTQTLKMFGLISVHLNTIDNRFPRVRMN